MLIGPTVFWMHQAYESLQEILAYRYKNLSHAYKIVETDIIKASKNIGFIA